MDSKQNQDGYIVEFVSVGNAMKVTAIDPKTMREVSMVGNPKLTRKHLAKKAVEKLRYVLEKEKNS